MERLEKSIEDKITEVMQIVVRNCYDKESNPINTQDDKLWLLCDFGYLKELKIMFGKCSLKKSWDFNIEDFEKKIDQDLQYLKSKNYN